MCKLKIMCTKEYMQIKKILNEEQEKPGYTGFHQLKPDLLSLECLHSAALSFLASSNANR